MEVMYEFKSIFNAMDFIKPLMIEGGCKIRIYTKFKDFPRENDIKCIQVIVKKLEKVNG